jgi:hypothetical protein
MLNLAICTYATIHLQKVQANGNNVSELVIELHQWFKLSSSRQEDY